MSHVIDDQDDKTYYDRNWRWLNPLLIAVMLPLAVGAAGELAPESIPTWLTAVVVTLHYVAMLRAGIGAAVTPTTSGRIIRVLAFCAGCALAAKTLFASELLSDFQERYRVELGPMTYVFVPGFRVTVDGEEFPIYGGGPCLKAQPARVYVVGGGFDYVGRGTYSCVVVEPTTKEVLVLRGTHNGPIREIWRVERDAADRIRLWTADGKPIVPVGRAGDR